MIFFGIPDDSEKESGMDRVLPKIIGSGWVSGTRQSLLGAYKYFIGPVLSYWLTVRLFSTGSTNSLQEASILF